MKAHEAALAIRRKLVDANPAVTEFQSDLAEANNNIGVLLRRYGEAGRGVEGVRGGAADPRNGWQGSTPSLPITPATWASCSTAWPISTSTPSDSTWPATGPAGDRLAEEGAGHQPEEPTVPAVPGLSPQQSDHSVERACATPRAWPKPNASWRTSVIRTRRWWLSTRGWPRSLREINNRRTTPIGYSSHKGPTTRRCTRRQHRLWGEALAADPKLGDDREAQHRYNAACAAAMAAAGKGKDQPSPDEAAKAKLRKQALDWLKAELSAWKRVSMIIEPGNKELVAKNLTHWKEDAELASIRDEKELSKLTEEERTAVKQLWNDVDGLLTKLGGRK